MSVWAVPTVHVLEQIKKSDSIHKDETVCEKSWIDKPCWFKLVCVFLRKNFDDDFSDVVAEVAQWVHYQKKVQEEENNLWASGSQAASFSANLGVCPEEDKFEVGKRQLCDETCQSVNNDKRLGVGCVTFLVLHKNFLNDLKGVACYHCDKTDDEHSPRHVSLSHVFIRVVGLDF